MLLLLKTKTLQISQTRKYSMQKHRVVESTKTYAQLLQKQLVKQVDKNQSKKKYAHSGKTKYMSTVMN